ncbi:formylglycine-generating enzyme family protein [Fluviicola sp.]|uniref:formylglycine-generating enzyme family protein n=1 Tax=Fluviicola sp. TaxID=1917219 RepID=UPI003D2D7FB9
MKYLLIGFTFLTCLNAFSQEPKPETVYSIAKEEKEASWYETQIKLWKTEIDKNNQNGNAWINYYRANRALRNLAQTEEERTKWYSQCKSIHEQVWKAMPKSFEAYFIQYSENGFQKDASEDLFAAQALRPNDPLIQDLLMIHYELQTDSEKRNFYANRLFENNELSVGILNWGYNVLSELDENAILFTCGDNDTYAGWIIQAAKSFRKDVTIVNTSLIMMDDYRNRLLKALGYPPLELKAPATEQELEANTMRIYKHFFEGKRPVYVATTTISSFEKDFGDKLYLTGLAYKYSSSNFDNTTIIKRNYEKRYLLDYLKEVFSYNISDLKGEVFNAMYLPSMIKLYQHYAESEELSKKLELEPLLLKIAEQSGQQNDVLELLSGKDKSTSFLSTVLDLKTIEKNMVELNGSVYMDKYEVTNGDYRKFLSNLERSNQTDLYQIAMYDSTQWTKGKFADKSLDPMGNMYHWHPAYDNYPIVCISYDGAKAYCEWLTKQYNLQRKRTYTQVVFRLPTELEWRTAAGSGDPKAITPFPNNSIKNASDCYLANIQPVKGHFFEDGGFHQVNVKSYLPNKLGLLNTFGNVSEMTGTKGTALGGSWYNLFEECTFDKTQSYSNPDPGVGFRVVMEIIEK